MEPEKPQEAGKQLPEKTKNVRQPVDAQSDEPTAESFDQANLERRPDDGLILPNNPGPIARMLRDDLETPREEIPGESFIPLPEVADPAELPAMSDPLRELEATSSGAIGGDDSLVGLSPAEMEKLVQQVNEAMAAQQTSPDAASPDKLAGYVFRPIEGEGPKSEGAAGETATDAKEPPSTRPRVGDSTPDVDRSGTEMHRGAERNEKLVAPPRVVVMVQLADAQALMEEDRIALAPEMAAMVQEIADARIESAENTRINQRRAADYRLRR